MAAPGREVVKGARTDAFRLVWVYVFALKAGETRSASDIIEQIAKQIDPKGERGLKDRGLHWTVTRALRIAAEVKLVSCIVLPPPAGRRHKVWARHPWPATVNIEWLISKGARPTVAKNFLLALETAGWLRADFRRAK